MDLSDAIKRMKYDKRLLEFNLKQDMITEKEYEDHLASLSDLEKDSELFRLKDLESGIGAESSNSLKSQSD